MRPFLPTAHAVMGGMGLALALALLFVLGAGLCGRRAWPETKLLAGWGVLCMVLTLWGIATPRDLRWPLAALAACALAVLLRRPTRARLGPMGGVSRMLLVMLPLSLAMLPLLPSEIDTWLNLLPNAAYLFDHGMLPAAGRPPSFSFLPVAPYNTQFVAFPASVASGAFAEAAMGWFNLALLGAAALLMARCVAGGADATGERAPPWWACALGLLLVMPANPGFVPRVFLSPYGEASLAVTALFAVWLAADMLADLAACVRWPRAMVPLGCVLAAMVNIKQSGLGLVLPIGATMAVIGMAHRGIRSARAVAAMMAVFVPALALYGLWRPFAEASFPEGELKLLPADAWNWALLPGILAAMAHVAIQKAAYFACEAAVIGRALWRCGPRWSRETLVLAMVAGTVVLFNLFLLLTYVAHFPPAWALEAHSYARYSSQVSLAVMLALVLALRPLIAARLARPSAHRVRQLTAVMVGIAVLLPIVGIRLLRFDLDAPQPQLRMLAQALAARVTPGQRIALVLPGDRDDSVGSMLRGLLLFTPPRRPDLDIRVEPFADAPTLARLAAAGVGLTLVSCTPAGLEGVPPGRAALLERAAGAWRVVETMDYPPDLAHRRFGAMLQRGPVCADRPQITADGQPAASR